MAFVTLVTADGHRFWIPKELVSAYSTTLRLMIESENPQPVEESLTDKIGWTPAEIDRAVQKAQSSVLRPVGKPGATILSSQRHDSTAPQSARSIPRVSPELLTIPISEVDGRTCVLLLAFLDLHRHYTANPTLSDGQPPVLQPGGPSSVGTTCERKKKGGKMVPVTTITHEPVSDHTDYHQLSTFFSSTPKWQMDFCCRTVLDLRPLEPALPVTEPISATTPTVASRPTKGSAPQPAPAVSGPSPVHRFLLSQRYDFTEIPSHRFTLLLSLLRAANYLQVEPLIQLTSAVTASILLDFLASEASLTPDSNGKVSEKGAGKTSSGKPSEPEADETAKSVNKLLRLQKLLSVQEGSAFLPADMEQMLMTDLMPWMNRKQG